MFLPLIGAALSAGYAAATAYLESSNSRIYHNVTKPTKEELGNLIGAAHTFYRVSRDDFSHAQSDKRPAGRSVD